MVFLALQSLGTYPVIQECAEFMKNKGKWRTCIAVTALLLVGTVKMVGHIRKQMRRKKWNNAGKDVAVLHMFRRGYFSPNLSPFVMKLEMYLRMARIPYQIDHEESLGPKGKSPWITLNGEEIADSQIIMDRLGLEYGKEFSAHLSLEEKAVAQAMRIMVEEHLLWCYAYWQYIHDDMKDVKKVVKVPAIWLPFMPLFKGYVKRAMKMQGMGRHTHQEIEEMGRKDLAVLSIWLENKPYFMGDKPTEVDCAIFGALAQIQWNSPGSPYLKMIESDFSNLSAYCFRIKEKFWPDWNKCLDLHQA
ncbi:hypothetical protein SK128_002001 [Halocaridina rubra]|uniref:Uncharacterized protein n=1 Tax=Halocaridina rubra TaxID=373956 RepID=A0AAN8XFP6_HALRR